MHLNVLRVLPQLKNTFEVNTSLKLAELRDRGHHKTGGLHPISHFAHDRLCYKSGFLPRVGVRDARKGISAKKYQPDEASEDRTATQPDKVWRKGPCRVLWCYMGRGGSFFRESLRFQLHICAPSHLLLSEKWVSEKYK